MGKSKKRKQKKDKKRIAAMNKSVEQSVCKTISDETKSKTITARIYPGTLERFTEINQARGMTNSSVINMMISDYVLSNGGSLR